MAETDGAALRSGRPGARDRSALTAVSLMLVCGRFDSPPIQKFADLFGTGAGFSLKPRYNIAPTQALLLARNGRGATESSCPCTGA
jgi:hypothetical protein